MSLVRELKFFLVFLVKQLKDVIFLSQARYAEELVKKFGQDKAKTTHTPMSTSIHLSQDLSGKDVEKTLYWRYDRESTLFDNKLP